MKEFSDASFVFDNEALYDLCNKNLEIDNPRFTNINRLIAQIVSSLTSPMRFKKGVNYQIDDFKKNLVPY